MIKHSHMASMLTRARQERLAGNKREAREALKFAAYWRNHPSTKVWNLYPSTTRQEWKANCRRFRLETREMLTGVACQWS